MLKADELTQGCRCAPTAGLQLDNAFGVHIRACMRDGTGFQNIISIQKFEEVTENFNKSFESRTTFCVIAQLFAKVRLRTIAASLLPRRVWELQPPSQEARQSIKENEVCHKKLLTKSSSGSTKAFVRSCNKPLYRIFELKAVFGSSIDQS